MPPVTPYTPALGDREPLSAIEDSLARLARLTRDWTAADFDRPWAPGKWTARQILVHLAQTEVALGARARTALASYGTVTVSLWPSWVSAIPQNADRVTLTVEEGTASAGPPSSSLLSP